jgi:hypothetical protein
VERKFEYRIMSFEYRTQKWLYHSVSLVRYFSPSFLPAKERVGERSDVRVSRLYAMPIGNNLIFAQ